MESRIVHYVIWFRLEKFSDFNNPGAVKDIIKKYQEDNNVEFKDRLLQNIERLRSVPVFCYSSVFALVSALKT